MSEELIGLELSGVSDFLISVAEELEDYIEAKNLELKSKINPQDLDDPDYHDYQTCFELMKLANRINKVEQSQ